MIARQVARGARKAIAEATRGYSASRRAARKDAPQVTYHSPRPGEAPAAPPRPTAAEAPVAPSSASSSAGASSGSSGSPSASSAEASGASSSSRATPSPPRDLPGGGTSRGTPASVPSGTPLPPEKRGGVSPFVLALAAGASLGAYAYVSGRPGDDAADPARPAERRVTVSSERSANDPPVRGVKEKEKETAADESERPLAPAARAAARRLLKRNDAEVRGADALLGEKDDDASKDASSAAKETVSKEDREVFGTAADAILAAADAAADAARRADEKDGAAKRRDSGADAAAAGGDSDLEGPALAARGKALEAVAATVPKDATVSRLVRARSKRAQEEVAELTPTALVAKSFQGAAEDIERTSAAFRAMTFQAESDARAFAGALETSDRERRKELAALEARLTEAHANAAEDASRQIQSLASEIDRSERRVASLAAALTEAGEAAERAAERAAADAAETTRAALAARTAELKRAAAECLIRERIARHEALDETRVAVNALNETLAVNSANLEASHFALRLHVAVDALAEAAARGEANLADRVAALQACCASRGEKSAEEDAGGRALVEAVLEPLAREAAMRKEGVPTVASLTNRLADVARAARRLALVPASSGGALTYVVSGLASFLRVREGVSEESSGNASGVEAALAAAAEAMARGRLAEAAAALEGGVKGSAAESACAGWIADARERQRLEMAVAVLRAHAAAETATVA